MQILDGKLVSQVRREKLRARLLSFVDRVGRSPHLVVILVGDLVASQVYVRNKQKACEDIGMRSTRIDLPATTSQTDLNQLIDKLNADIDVDGVLVQLPLPKGVREDEINQRLSASKDSDGFTFVSLGHLCAGQKIVAPCTPAGVMALLEHYQILVEGKHAVVVGRSLTVGKPMAQLLLEANATVTICHSKTANLREMTRQGDLVVVAAGRRHLLGKEDFKQGSVVIDVGIHGSGVGKGLAGDVRFEELKGWVSAASPVPGGVGPMTITMLLENTLLLAEKRAGLR